MNASWGARSEIGLVRKGNEDSYLVQEPLFVVADGMGGHIAGDVASSTAVEVITSEAGDADASNPETLAEIVRHANARIFQRAEEDNSLHGMGTTCTLLMLDDGRAHVAHVGDSRAYLLRNDQFDQVTEDHTLVARMVREGRLSEEEAHRHPQRSVITRALGVDTEVDVDMSTVNLEDGDRVLLCSDGLSSMVPNEAIAEVLSAERDPQSAADRLVDLALEAGGEDNVTVVVLYVGDAAPAGDPEAGRATQTASAAAVEDVPGAWAPPAERAPAEQTGVVSTIPPRSRNEPTVVPDDAPARRSIGRRLVMSLVVLLVVVGSLYAAGRYALQNSWFIGVNEDGFVTVYQGRPETIAGWTLAEAQEVTTLRVDELPEYVHDDLEEGIKVESLEDAQTAVANLEDRSRPPGGGG
ncbi:MAG TPA: Stp1/IreP family PP2C-type Ser/Thr phosphatase [Actinomycetota bacterium]|nr:Stp1/IreP family PP2C-type Ser/Thr phosphatase [Actinomycetota bacterium]